MEKWENYSNKATLEKPNCRDAWLILFGNEIIRLDQGMKGRNKGTNTMAFIKKEEVPQNKFRDFT